MAETKKPGKNPKIIQVFFDGMGQISGVLYDNGRVFLWNWTKWPYSGDGKDRVGEGYWAELTYPDLNAIDKQKA